MSTESRSPQPTVLLTGFPGFLGSALVERLIDHGDGPIACLIQPAYRGRAEKRAQEITSDRDAIQLYEGDITRPELGLSDVLPELAAVSELYHLAAVYDLAVDPDIARAVNIRGTEHVLSVAAQLGVDRFHYVSTCYVSGRYDGVFTESHLKEGQQFNNYYEWSKYEAEVRVQEKMDDGFPATIYRPSIVVGDSKTGVTGKYDGPYYLIRLLLRQPRWCSVITKLPKSTAAELNVVPQDFVIDAIDALRSSADTCGNVYHLCDPHPLSVPEFVSTIATETGRRVIPAPTSKRTAKLVMSVLKRLQLPAEPATIDYLDHPTRYANPKTRPVLEDAGVMCPPFASYADRLLSFVIEQPTIQQEAIKTKP